jgi:3-oxoacyl-[acyl-carrier protein] reductase
MAATGELAKESIRVLGKVNVLVNNAGLSGRGMITDIPEETIDALLNVNFKGTIRCAKIFAPFLINFADGIMINMSSQAGKRGWPELSVYGATKAGVLGMNRALAVELAPEVRVNAICPGYINDVGMAWRGWELRSNQEGGSAGTIGKKFALDNIPLERLQKAENIARADVFLAFTDAKEITGAALNVGGGVVMD